MRRCLRNPSSGNCCTFTSSRLWNNIMFSAFDETWFFLKTSFHLDELRLTRDKAQIGPPRRKLKRGRSKHRLVGTIIFAHNCLEPFYNRLSWVCQGMREYMC